VRFQLQNNGDTAVQNGHPFPGARSSIIQVPVIRAQKLTNSGSVKTTLAIDLDISVSYFFCLKSHMNQDVLSSKTLCCATNNDEMYDS
jgi:hypothetical protein